MLKHTVTYVDFNDTERTEDFFFNLTSQELMELDREYDGGIQGHLVKIMETNDALGIFAMVQKLILKAYGQKSEDGRFFKKSPEFTAEFESSAAYQAMVDDMFEHPETANVFVTGVLPKNLRDKAEKVDQKEAMKALLKDRAAT